MNRPVVALGIDAMSAPLLERWVAEGQLPALARLFREGTYARQKGITHVEGSWLELLQGCQADGSGEWGHQDYDAADRRFTERGSYDFRHVPPFYALARDRRVAIFDVPHARLMPQLQGVQALGWGTESNQLLRQSAPEGLMDELLARHGRHPVYAQRAHKADGTETMSFRIPCIYDPAAMTALRDALVAAAGQRTAIITDLLRRERWDLFVSAYAESHTAGHLLWHYGRAHALAPDTPDAGGEDYMLDVMQAIDRGIGEVMQALPADASVFIFSPHGMQANATDLYTMLFLPELVYRWSTGHAALAEGPTGALPVPRHDFRRHWREEVWALRTPHGEAALESPAQQEARGDPLDWDPANWYRGQWPAMRAFTLPGYSDGMVRINVAGRDGEGGIAAEDYDAVCEELRETIAQLTDARSGRPMAARVTRVRRKAHDGGAGLTPADLVVTWDEDVLTDVVAHPRLGRIGPAPFFRSGGHTPEGFVLARGAGFAAGARLEPIAMTDFTATLIAQLGIELPGHVEGRPMKGRG